METTATGRAYAFNMTTGSLISNLTSPQAIPISYFGSAVAINNGIIIVRASGYGSCASDSNPGYACMFSL